MLLPEHLENSPALHRVFLIISYFCFPSWFWLFHRSGITNTVLKSSQVSLKRRREWQFLQNHKWSFLELLNYFVEHLLPAEKGCPGQAVACVEQGSATLRDGASMRVWVLMRLGPTAGCCFR